MQKLSSYFIALTAFLGFIISSSCYQGRHQYPYNITKHSHHSFWGEIHFEDTKFPYYITKSSEFRKIVTQDAVFPKAGTHNNRPITAIRAFDQKKDGNGAYATIKSGGINSISTIVHFESKRGHGIDFMLEIWVR